MIKLLATEDELAKISETLMQMRQHSNIFVFRGDLGVGKTTLIKNICNFLTVKDEVNSPTFSIVNEYRTESDEVIYHFDFYRIEEEEEALDMGVEDYFYNDELCLIEWPSRIESLLPEPRIEVAIREEQNKREFIIKPIN